MHIVLVFLNHSCLHSQQRPICNESMLCLLHLSDAFVWTSTLDFTLFFQGREFCFFVSHNFASRFCMSKIKEWIVRCQKHEATWLVMGCIFVFTVSSSIIRYATAQLYFALIHFYCFNRLPVQCQVVWIYRISHCQTYQKCAWC